MSPAGSQSVDDTLAARCRELGLPLWQWGPDGSIVAEPEGWDSAESWLHAPLLRQQLLQSRPRWRPEHPPRTVDLFSGCWLIPLLPDESKPAAPLTLAMVLAGEALETREFTAICGSASVDPSRMRVALAPLARYRRSDVEQVARTLSWLHEDQIRMIEQSSAIDNFSQQLADAYEKVNLLYTIGASTIDMEEPMRFLREACTLLHEAMSFRWIAVRLASLRGLGRVLANDLLVLGELGCSHTQFDRQAGELLKQDPDQDWTVILETEKSELAAIVGTDVIACPMRIDEQIGGVVLAGAREGGDAEPSSMDVQLLEAVAGNIRSFVQNVALYNEHRTTLLGTIRAISATIDAKDRYTRGHSDRVAQLATQLGAAMGLSPTQIERVRLAGLLHDVGKIGVPEAVLRKPGRLTRQELDLIRLHPVIGYRILNDIEPLSDVTPAVLHHHEQWDGEGYPQGLREEKIPLYARIVAVADTFDAMSSNRAYRQAVMREKVLTEIEERAGTQFDPQLASVFVGLNFAEYDAMIARHLESDREAA